MALQYQKDGKPTGSESLNRRIGVTGNVNFQQEDTLVSEMWSLPALKMQHQAALLKKVM